MKFKQLNEMAYPRDYIIEKCASLGNQFAIHFNKIVKEGKDLTIVAIGKMVEKAKEVAELLKKDNIDAEIINARFLKPLDKEAILKSIEKTKNIATIEDGLIEGGLRN